jgi:Pyridoxamine 5'-phosphate oxidase
MILEGNCLEVLEATEFVTIVTMGPDGPHVVATWGDYIRKLGVKDDRLSIPAGWYFDTEENLKRDSRIQLLVAARQVQGRMGPGQGYELSGTGTILTEGDEVDRVRGSFPWARGALVIDVEKAEAQL